MNPKLEYTEETALLGNKPKTDRISKMVDNYSTAKVGSLKSLKQTQ
jgi:hypothetical protein